MLDPRGGRVRSNTERGETHGGFIIAQLAKVDVQPLAITALGY